jgi:hypothetical protein
MGGNLGDEVIDWERAMDCKLCHQEKKLCQSHIIPELAYGPLYDDKHRFFAVANTEKRLAPLQKGLREPLLCEECEQFLNKYDSYFANEWYTKGLGPAEVREELCEIEGLDYHRFKLFHMSILWRAGVASRAEFREVNLGQHESRLRELILRDDPGDPNEYAVFGYVLASPKDNAVYQALVMEPVSVELYDVPGFQFVFGGCAWHYLLADSVDPKVFPFVFERSGILRLLRLVIDEYHPVMDVITERLKKGWRLRR